MKNTDITKIRQLLKKANICKIIPGTVIIEAEVYNQILALLPCETCGGTGKITETRTDTAGFDFIDKATPCPDCQS